MISSSAECASESSTASRSSSTNESDSSTNGTPRKMISGGTTDLPSCSEMVATTMKMPSADSMRRSRRATSSMSPTSIPSTKIRPACSRSAHAGARGIDLERQPVLAAEDRLRRHAHRLGQLRVQPQPLVVAVHRHHVARVGQVDHQLELLGIAVPRGVHRHVRRRDRRWRRACRCGRSSRSRRARCRGSAWPRRSRCRRRGAPRSGGRRAPSAAAPRAARPGDPVEMITSLSSGKSSISFGPTSIPSGMSMWPSMRPMLVFLRIERPTSDDARSSAAAASTTCCTRWMFDAKQVTTMRPVQRANTSLQLRAHARLGR